MQPSSLHISLNPERRLFLSPSMKLGLSILQLPFLDLKEYVAHEVEQNPLLEWKEDRAHEENFTFPEHLVSFSRKEIAEVPKKESPFEKLFFQIHTAFKEDKEKEIAHYLLNQVDEKGFLTTSIKEIAQQYQIETEQVEAIRSKIQHFDPPGVGSKNLQEYLLLQLEEKEEKNSFAYLLLQNHFEELLQAHFSIIEKKLKIDHKKLLHALEQIRHLQRTPLIKAYEKNPPVIPTFFLFKEESRWIYKYNESLFLRYNPIYLSLLTTKQKELKGFVSRAELLMTYLEERKKLVKKIAYFLLKRQRDFFEGKGNLLPLTIKEMAKHLALHPSTAARAVAHKYLSCPFGIFSLRFFFPSAVSMKKGGKISHQKALHILQTLIEKEDKEHPYSDEELSILMKKADICCARRTIVKYRKKLAIQTAAKRKLLFHYVK